MNAREQLNTTGVWTFTDATMSADETAEMASRIEQLGYSTLWLPETTGRDPFVLFAHLANHTSTLLFATGIANIFHRHPGMTKQSTRTLAELSDGRFILGIGVSHAPMVAGVRQLDYSKPLTQMRAYLDAMEASPATSPAPDEEPLMVLAALGPKMLELSAERSDGAHPYFTTPTHTAQAREIMGPDSLLCVEQKYIFSTDVEAARTAAAAQTDRYGALPNYRNNWKRLGFTDEQIDSHDPAFLDAVVVWGDAETIQARIDEHYAAGADHVCIQPISPAGAPEGIDWAALEALAPGSA